MPRGCASTTAPPSTATSRWARGRRRATPAEPRTPAAQRYLEAIYYIEHEGEVARPGRLAEWLGVRAPTVSVSLQRLARDGWVSVAPDRSVALTARGAAAAEDIVRRHRIVERWLTDVLQLDWATADREAAELAPGISTIVLERLDAQLGHPATCPHGNLIPGRTPPRGRRLVRLVEVAARTPARVARISEVAEKEAPQLLSVLSAHAVVPGAHVEVVGRSETGRWRVNVGTRTAELEPHVAEAVWIEQP